MKRILFIFALFGLAHTVQAQVEIKTNPVALLFEALPVSVEYCINDSWGTELDAFATADWGFLYLSAKHYFSPRKGTDGFNIGSFAGGAGGDGDSGFGLGFFAGYKGISTKNILLEIALGIGRDFTDNVEVLPYFKFHVGYRFGGD